jgi:hypothetical protein
MGEEPSRMESIGGESPPSEQQEEEGVLDKARSWLFGGEDEEEEEKEPGPGV